MARRRCPLRRSRCSPRRTCASRSGPPPSTSKNPQRSAAAAAASSRARARERHARERERERARFDGAGAGGARAQTDKKKKQGGDDDDDDDNDDESEDDDDDDDDDDNDNDDESEDDDDDDDDDDASSDDGDMVDDINSDDEGRAPEHRLMLRYRPPKKAVATTRCIAGRTTIGSDPSNDIVIGAAEDPAIAPLHATIELDAATGTFFIVDGASPRGTWVKLHDHRAPFELHWGDVVRMGGAELKVARGRRLRALERLDRGMSTCLVRLFGLHLQVEQKPMLRPLGDPVDGALVYPRWRAYRDLVQSAPPKNDGKVKMWTPSLVVTVG